jgi:hypothetical protein
MPQVTIPLPGDLLDRIGRLARHDERSRPAEMRWLLSRAVSLAESGKLVGIESPLIADSTAAPAADREVADVRAG